jgi:hypothetical protein
MFRTSTSFLRGSERSAKEKHVEGLTIFAKNFFVFFLELGKELAKKTREGEKNFFRNYK